MRVRVNIFSDCSSDLGIQGIRFDFELDDKDVTNTISKNAGNSNILLKERYCNFYFPIIFDLPHPDLCAFAALKIISPYVGYTFDMDRGVSNKMAEQIKKQYPSILEVKVDEKLQAYTAKKDGKSVVSFSGGVDSIAASVLMGNESPLIMTARTEHPNIGKYEQWNNPRAQIKTLTYMPYDFSKVLVYTDFPYLSVNTTDNYCIYPDSYAFTIPCVLLAEKLNIAHIITGDIMAAFIGNETIYNEGFTSLSSDFFTVLGINLDYPCNGISELVTTKIAKENGLLEISSACEYGDFMQPCMKCIKCFRKSIYKWALFDESLTDMQLKTFNDSPAIDKYANNDTRRGLDFMPSYKFCFEKIQYSFTGNIKKIYDRSMKYNEPVSWVDRRFKLAYKNRDPVIRNAISQLDKYAPEMLSYEESFFKRLNWKKIYNQVT